MNELRSLGRRRLWQFLSKRERSKLFLQAFDARLRAGHRDAVRIYFEAAALCGIERQTQVAAQIFMSFGVRDEGELRALVASGKRMEQIRNDATKNLDDLEHDAVDLLKLVLSMEPERRSRVIAELGGMLALPRANGAAT